MGSPASKGGHFAIEFTRAVKGPPLGARQRQAQVPCKGLTGGWATPSLSAAMIISPESPPVRSAILNRIGDITPSNVLHESNIRAWQ